MGIFARFQDYAPGARNAQERTSVIVKAGETTTIRRTVGNVEFVAEYVIKSEDGVDYVVKTNSMYENGELCRSVFRGEDRTWVQARTELRETPGAPGEWTILDGYFVEVLADTDQGPEHDEVFLPYWYEPGFGWFRS